MTRQYPPGGSVAYCVAMTDSASNREGTGQVTVPAAVSSAAEASIASGAGAAADAAAADAAALETPVEVEVCDESEEAAERPPWDLPTSIVGLVILAAVTTTAAMLGMYLGWAGAGCGSAAGCNDALILAGLFMGTLGVIITAIVFLVITIARITVKRIAWWLPLIGIGAVVLVFLVGALLAGAGSAG